MKTMQELYDEVIASDELKAKFIEATKAGKQEEFLKEHGCNASVEEVAAFIRAKFEEDTPLSLNELNQTAGGLNKNQKEDIVLSVFTAGLYCGIAPLVTFIQEKTGPFAHLGMKKPDDGYFCNNN